MKTEKISRNMVIKALYNAKNTNVYLRKYKCLHTFTRQLKLTNRDENLIKDLYKAVLRDDTKEIILRAFAWEDSKEGSDYWIDIYKNAK